MHMDTVVVNFDEYHKKQICFVINNLSNYKVIKDLTSCMRLSILIKIVY